jgi:hypothetical protein
MLRLAMRRAKTQKMVFYEGGNELGNSSRRKSKESGGTIVIVDDACAGNLLIRPVFGRTRQKFMNEGSKTTPLRPRKKYRTGKALTSLFRGKIFIWQLSHVKKSKMD